MYSKIPPNAGEPKGTTKAMNVKTNRIMTMRGVPFFFFWSDVTCPPALRFLPASIGHSLLFNRLAANL